MKVSDLVNSNNEVVGYINVLNDCIVVKNGDSENMFFNMLDVIKYVDKNLLMFPLGS